MAHDNQQGKDGMQKPKKQWSLSDLTDPVVVSKVALGIGLAGAVIWGASRYKVAEPTQYLVKTGLGIADMAISKTTFLFPFQRVQILSLEPASYQFTLSAMSAEKLNFQLPASFTIGPRDDNTALVKYARFVSSQDHDTLTRLVQGIIEGETRVLAAGMSIEDIFRSRNDLKKTIVEHITEELGAFGLQVWNANIKDLQDAEGSEYFRYLRQKTVEGAVNQAKVDVSEARKRGEVGEKARQGETRQEVARIEMEAVVSENSRKKGIADSEAALKVAQTEAKRMSDLAAIDAQQATAMRKAELEKGVAMKQVEANMEALRATDMSAATVAAEKAVKVAAGNAEAQSRAADGDAYAVRTAADASLFKVNKAADGDLYSTQRNAEGSLARAKADAEGMQLKFAAEADGTRLKYEAEAQGLTRVRDALGGSSSSLLQYLMIERGVYQSLAQSTADAVRGMAPKVTVWSQGGDAKGTGADGATSGGGVWSALNEVYRGLPPLAAAIHDQTGMSLPTWLIQQPKNTIDAAGSPVVGGAAAPTGTAAAGTAVDALVQAASPAAAPASKQGIAAQLK